MHGYILLNEYMFFYILFHRCFRGNLILLFFLITLDRHIIFIFLMKLSIANSAFDIVVNRCGYYYKLVVFGEVVNPLSSHIGV